MKPFILQDWITVRSTGTPPAPTGPNFVQDSAGWLDLSIFQDVVIWFDLRATTVVTGTTLTWNFETSPTKDDTLFQSLASSGPWGTNVRTLVVLPATLANAIGSGSVALATWLRWTIVPGGASPNQPWSATFRVILAANQVVKGTTQVGRSAALQALMATLGHIDVSKPASASSSVVQVQQMAPVSPLGQGPGPSQGMVIQPVQSAMTGISQGGLGNVGP